MYLYYHGNDSDFLTVCGLDRRSFIEVHDIVFNDEKVQTAIGRPLILDSFAQLGVYLHYINSTMKIKTLCQIFGASFSTIYRILCKLWVLVPLKLGRYPKCKVVWPDNVKKQYLASLVCRRYPRIKNVIGFVDGVKFPVHSSDDPEEQNADYNGWLCGCYVNNVFVFSPEGLIIFASINNPGSWHDAVSARDLYKILIEENDYAIAADTAFPSTDLVQFLVNYTIISY